MSELCCKNGKAHGLETWWYENGKKEKEKYYKGGKEDGPWTEWDEDGKMTFQGTFKDGNEL